MYRDSKTRTIVKAITWRITATLTTIALVYLFTGQIQTAVEVGVLEMTAKLLFYYGHERLWDKLMFGRVEVPPFVLWITGIPHSGKTTLGDIVHKKLKSENIKTQRLDSHDVRPLFPETGFTRKEVNSHIKRVGHLTSMMENNGISTIASFVSPFTASRDFVRGICQNYIEVYLKASADEISEKYGCELYEKAKKGLVQNVAGMDIEYETSPKTELIIEMCDLSLEEAADRIVSYLKKNNL